MGEPTVTVHTGKILGTTRTNIHQETFYSFLGIPYATPPVGNLRFKSPQPPQPWSGTFHATKEGEECFAKHAFLNTLSGGEDCLYLNVFTPQLPNANPKLRPVMFWIHGGGFTSGSSSTDIYGPDYLLTEDIVLVTINYRTGILGFLSLDDPGLEVPGNAGLKDMVMALKWVQQNIANFCGDPDNVTIFGESAGAAACHYLILSPVAKGLFHRAILQSGSALSIWARGQNYAQELAKILNLPTRNEKEILEYLMKMPVEQLYLSAAKMPDLFIACTKRPHGPVIEKPSKDAFITQEPIEIIKSGNYNHVPIIIGFTTREGILSEILQKPKPFKPITDFEMSVPYYLNLKKGSQDSKAIAKQIKQFYYGTEEPTDQNKDIFYMMETDNFFLREILRTVKYHLETSKCPIFLYRMSIETSLNILKRTYDITEPGVAHADDLGYLFNNLLSVDLESDSDEQVAVNRFVKLWTSFATNGDPNPKNKSKLINVQWKPVSKNKLHFLDIDKQLKILENPEAVRMTFWHSILNRHVNHKL